MKYRKFGMLDWEASALGFGLSRLPLTDGGESIAMVRRAIDHGVNYMDLGMPYDGARHQSLCGLLGRALQDGYRERVRVAMTIPALRIKKPSDFDRCLDEQLRWLAMDGIDFCLVGRLNRENWPDLEHMGLFSSIDNAMADGRIKRIGFSFHDHYQVLKKIIAAYEKWSLCQFQYSYMEVDHDPGIGGIKYAAEKGLAVVVRESLKSGRLTRQPPETVAQVWAGAGTGQTLAERGLRFVLNHAEVSTVVSDMTTIEQVLASAAVAGDTEPDSLSIPDELLVNRVRDAYRKLRPIPCPSCRPCMPCPVGIDVPRVFEIYNDAVMYGDVETARSVYRDEGHDAASCTECGVCAGRCAKRLPVPDLLKQVCEKLP